MSNPGRPEKQTRFKGVIGTVNVHLPRRAYFSHLTIAHAFEAPITINMLEGFTFRDHRRSSYEGFNQLYETLGSVEALLGVINRPAHLALVGETTVFRNWNGDPVSVTPEQDVISLYDPEETEDEERGLLSAIPGNPNSISNPLEIYYQGPQFGSDRWIVALTNRGNPLVTEPRPYGIGFIGYYAGEVYYEIKHPSSVVLEGILRDAIQDPASLRTEFLGQDFIGT